jgi:hypothetical protein
VNRLVDKFRDNPGVDVAAFFAAQRAMERKLDMNTLPRDAQNAVGLRRTYAHRRYLDAAAAVLVYVEVKAQIAARRVDNCVPKGAVGLARSRLLTSN